MSTFRMLAVGLCVLVALGGSARAYGEEKWDASYDLKHEDDGVKGHETATDLHLKYALDDGESVSEAKADGADGTKTHGEEGTEPNTLRTATLEWDFDPGIARGSSVKIKIKASGSKLSLIQAWWTYASGRGGSVLSVGPDLDSDTCTLLLSNNSEEAVDGTVAFATTSTRIPIENLNFGEVAGFLPTETISLAAGESVELVPPSCDQVLLMEVAITGADSGLQLNSIFQHIPAVIVPAVSQWGLVGVALATIAGGLIILRRRFGTVG